MKPNDCALARGTLACWLLGIASGPISAPGAAPAAPAPAASRRPNVLFVMTDQQPMSTIGAYGNRRIRTPHMDRLAREGMRFDQVHIAAFACSPSRASYWTGRWSHRHGVVINDVVLDDTVPTLGSVARAHGYQAAFVGKWHLGGNMYARDAAERWAHRRIADAADYVFDTKGSWRGGEDEPQCGFLDMWVGGWTHYHAYLRGVGLGNLLEGNRRVGNHNMAPSGAEGTHIHSQIPAAHHEAAFLAGEAVRFIRHERDRSKPFCLVLSIYGPHLPVAPPKPWDNMYDARQVPLPDNFRDTLADKPAAQRNNAHCLRSGDWSEAQYRDYIARYWGYCSYIDQQLGRVLGALDDEGITDDTIIVCTTDHGDMIGAHGFIFKLGSGYDELMRVPFLVRYPRAVRPGSTTAALVQSIDVLPTLLDLCGWPAPPGIDGRSFRALLEGGSTEFRDHVMTMMSGALLFATRDWKLVCSDMRAPRAFLELYDRRDRPLEVINRAGESRCAPVLADMTRRLTEQLRAVGYPYAGEIERRLADARIRASRPNELVTPRVASFEHARDARDRPVAKFTVEWTVGPALSSAADPPRYWTFVHVLGPGGRAIVTRATLWPDPPTTTWNPATRHRVGPIQVPIPPGMKGSYPVRVGLYNPETKTRPPVEGEAQRIVGTLTVTRDQAGIVTLAFHPAD